jgi:HK97 gp10 family phage protein
MAVKVRIDGLREIEARLSELPKATGKNVLRRVLKKRAEPVAAAMEAGAPRLSGNLAASAGVSTKLTKRQGALHRKMFRNDRAAVEMFAGVGGLPQATQQEFGNEMHGPQPFARPAWDAHKMAMLDGIKDDLWSEISKAAARLARKAARGK